MQARAGAESRGYGLRHSIQERALTSERRRSFPGVACLSVLLACSGSDRPPGSVTAPPRPSAEIAVETERQQQTREALANVRRSDREVPETQILFGDLHVHTTY